MLEPHPLQRCALIRTKHMARSLCALLLFISVAAFCQCRDGNQEYKEDLLIRHLPDGKVSASFQLTTTWNTHPLKLARSRDHSEAPKVQHYGMFPKSLAEVITHYEAQELHLSLTRGKWRTTIWGYPPLSSPPGAELWAWFLPNVTDVSIQWKGLVNAVSGLMCASLNAISSTNTHHPPRSFKPQGAIFGNLSSSLLRYAALPREPVCTENLTPWSKLLPCGNKAGLGKLLTSLKLYDSQYLTIGIHWVPICKDPDCSEVGIELRQQLMVVLDASVTRRSKWSLSTLFTVPVNSCPLSSHSAVYIDTTSNIPGGVSLSPSPTLVEDVSHHGANASLAVYDLLTIEGSLDLSLSYKSTQESTNSVLAPPLLRTNRYVTGSGHEWGGLHTDIANDHTHPMRVVLLDMVPWFFRVMLHTLTISCEGVGGCDGDLVLSRHYTPAKDRQRPHTLEFLLHLPPSSTVSITVQFSRSFLKWTEYPPDAAHGFYINSAVVTTALEQCLNCTPVPQSMRNYGWDTADGLLLQVHTEPLLVSLPTPDFSMPYNVICFVSTVVAIAFGTIFNLTTKTLKPVEPDNRSLLARLLRRK